MKNKVKNLTIKERILQFIEYKEIAKTKFCENVGISKNNFSGKTIQSEIGGEQITKILKVYPEINPDWLLLGEGSMIKDFKDKAKNENDTQEKTDQEPTETSKESAFILAVRKFLAIIDQKEEEYDELKEKYEISKEEIKELKSEIKELKRV